MIYAVYATSSIDFEYAHKYVQGFVVRGISDGVDRARREEIGEWYVFVADREEVFVSSRARSS